MRIKTVASVVFAAAFLISLVDVQALFQSSQAAVYLRYAILGCLYLIIISWGLMWTPRAFYRIGWVVGLWVTYIMYACLSAAWSPNTSDALLKAGLIILANAAAYFSALMIVQYRMGNLVMWVLLSFTLASAAVAIALPDIGKHVGYYHAGSWKGLASHKNNLGAAAVYLFLLGFLSWKVNRPRNGETRVPLTLAWMGMAVGLGVAVLSSSRGALLILFLVGPFALIGASDRIARRQLLGLFGLTVPLVLAIVIGIVQIKGDRIIVLDAEVDTMSRVDLWRFGVNNLHANMFLGTGIEGFWTEEMKVEFQKKFGWLLTNFHNGYFAVYVELGILGAMLLTAIVLMALYRIFGWMGGAVDGQRLAWSILFVAFLVKNIYSDSITRSTDFFFFLFCVSVFMIDRLGSKRGAVPQGATVRCVASGAEFAPGRH